MRVFKLKPSNTLSLMWAVPVTSAALLALWAQPQWLQSTAQALGLAPIWLQLMLALAVLLLGWRQRRWLWNGNERWALTELYYSEAWSSLEALRLPRAAAGERISGERVQLKPRFSWFSPWLCYFCCVDSAGQKYHLLLSRHNLGSHKAYAQLRSVVSARAHPRP